MNRAREEPPTRVTHRALAFAGIAIVAGAVAFFGFPHWVMAQPLPPWVAVEPATAAICTIPLAVGLMIVAHRGPDLLLTTHLLSVAITLLIAGVFAYWFIAPAAGLVAVRFFEVDESALRTGTAVGAFLGLHHYIIDGVLWKLRNPDVRRQLFAHLGKEAAPDRR